MTHTVDTFLPYRYLSALKIRIRIQKRNAESKYNAPIGREAGSKTLDGMLIKKSFNWQTSKKAALVTSKQYLLNLNLYFYMEVTADTWYWYAIGDC
jgi:hypothetical protein